MHEVWPKSAGIRYTGSKRNLITEKSTIDGDDEDVLTNMLLSIRTAGYSGALP